MNEFESRNMEEELEDLEANYDKHVSKDYIEQQDKLQKAREEEMSDAIKNPELHNLRAANQKEMDKYDQIHHNELVARRKAQEEFNQRHHNELASINKLRDTDPEYAKKLEEQFNKKYRKELDRINNIPSGKRPGKINTDTNTTSKLADNISDVTIKKAVVKVKITFIIIIICAIVCLFLYVTIMSTLSEQDVTSLSGGSTTLGNVNGVGNYYVDGEDGDYLNSNIVYINENGESSTYSIDDFLVGAVYALTDDNLSEEVYKVYAILLRTNILSDDDGVIEYGDYEYKNVNNDTTKEKIENSIETTKYELLLDSSSTIIKTDFSKNNCNDCTIEDGISLNLVKELVKDNNYDYKQVLSAFFDSQNSTVIINNNPETSSISLELKDTTNATYLKTPIKSFLKSHNLSLVDLNNYISTSVEPVYGTGEGVATAAVALINYLYDGFKVKLPYYWGGKYLGTGANPSFGTYKPVLHNSGQVYNYISLDCSGLAQWAIYNGGFKNPGTGTAYFAYAFTKRCNITSPNCVGEVGDLINYRTYDGRRGHVQIIVAVDEKNSSYYIAESSTHGVVVTTRNMHKGRNDANVYVLHMSDYYAKNVRK